MSSSRREADDAADGERDALRREIARIVGPALPANAAMAIPPGVTVGDLVARLREVPSGAGTQALQQLFASFPRPEPPPPAWLEWPHPGGLFSRDEYARAFRLINASPAHLVDYYAAPPRGHPAFVLALLWHASPALAERVDAFRAEMRRERLASGMPPHDVDAADAAFAREREQLASLVERTRREERGQFGPGIAFRLRPGKATAFLSEIGRAGGFPTENAWLLDPDPADGTTPGGVALPYGASAEEIARAERWVRDHPAVLEARVHPRTGDDGSSDASSAAPPRG